MGQLHVLAHTIDTGAEDEDIKALAFENRRAALDICVRKYRERILHHALYVLRDMAEAFDVTQEVFIKAMREPRFFDEDFKIKAWLFRVTSNLCFNIVRDRRRRSVILEGMPAMREPDNDQFDALFNDERQKNVMVAMERLSEDHKEILTLRYYSDLSYVEIAEVLNVKLGTVMSRLSRAKSRLVEVLDEVAVS
jgi:RNA polymerase sigma-70 factor (ECF subfamily)